MTPEELADYKKRFEEWKQEAIPKERQKMRKRMEEERNLLKAQLEAKEKMSLPAAAVPKLEDSMLNDPFKKLAGSNTDSWVQGQPGSGAKQSKGYSQYCREVDQQEYF